MTFIVSADLVSVSTERPAKPENAISATFRGEEFIGSVITMFFDTAKGEFKAQQQQRAVERLGLRYGDKVHLSWTAADSFMLP